jgi:hypothetical protein
VDFFAYKPAVKTAGYFHPRLWRYAQKLKRKLNHALLNLAMPAVEIAEQPVKFLQFWQNFPARIGVGCNPFLVERF